jgi:hypothetical protein
MNYQNTFSRIDLLIEKHELVQLFLNDQIDMKDYLERQSALDELLGMIA